MRITDMRETKRGLIALFCDGEFLFSCDDLLLERYHLRIGDEIEEDTLHTLRSESESGKAVTKALRFLAIRAHSKGELLAKLLRSFDRDTAEFALERMDELGYLHDEEFAENYAAELVARKNTSLRLARVKMRGKGLSDDVINRALAPYGEDESDTIRLIIEKHYRNAIVSEQARIKAIRALEQRGFSIHDAQNVLRCMGTIDEESL